MANKMLIDASHPEETRVVVLRGNRVEEFDFEAASRKQLRGNIYLAKVTRVEPSLQAAFVEYGGNRHGFLAFSEIHPDYYQIPTADRQALLEEEARAHAEAEDDENRGQRRSRRFRDRNGNAQKRAAEDETVSEAAPQTEELIADDGDLQDLATLNGPVAEDFASEADPEAPAPVHVPHDGLENIHERTVETLAADEDVPHAVVIEAVDVAAAPLPVEAEAPTMNPQAEAVMAAESETAEEVEAERDGDEEDEGDDEDGEDDDEEGEDGDAVEEITTLGGGSETEETELTPRRDRRRGRGRYRNRDRDRDERQKTDEDGEEEAQVEQVGGDAIDETPHRVPRLRRQYKIQEVIKRRQVLLIQVVKEERGNKGAALTTYLSLAGRYSVLMPNTARGGGISRKITDGNDRKRLKEIARELEVPEGMGVILRTAGASRSKPEVKRDFEYLLRMWETVRELTLESTAPALVYEEGSLIKRAIRDLYNKDIDEVIVSGDDGYREAKDFMRMLMPSHAKNVKPFRDPQPLFAKYGAEAQLDAMFSNQVTLKSGGYLVINQTEALVAIDVNSGRSTREHNIEDTALRTNLEAADEVARQLRLRDLAGLVVVDFIDMEEGRNNRSVERRLKDALKNDRARIQVGRISHFGLLEMSRQRIRTGVMEGSTVVCPHCVGVGMVRSTSSIALHVLRVLEDALIRNSDYDLIVRTRTTVALYILNQKRSHLRELEKRFGVAITVAADDTLTGTAYHALERGELANPVPAPEQAQRASLVRVDSIPPVDEDEADEGDEDNDVEAQDESTEAGASERTNGEDSERRRRRRRRRRGRGSERESSGIQANAPQPTDAGLAAVAEIDGTLAPVADETSTDDETTDAPETGDGENRFDRRNRRRGRGRRFQNEGDREESAQEADSSAQAAETVPASTPIHPVGFEWDTPEPVEAPAQPAVANDVPAPAPQPPAAPEVGEPAREPDPPRAWETMLEAEAEVDPNRPKRSGWWARAKQTLVGK
ncbi:Rne/Rng family ribonuclease [Methylovirgula sp. 4M-Z18]|uniref:Rne/Rng family ribonuclease n=1 Tax=Methylovirgula sp. 4M-Z18 TaxID=2293567 RepID=UPI000E2F50F9|nr:ribonuclease E/G [Methylovirgula sp. 4M-Z18]RFB80806.1 ribonuclease E/G [Methylovirgula sp. 4M-Z18]